MNNLLPIIELMYSSISKAKNIKYDYIDKNIISSKTFLEFFKVLKSILIGREKNFEEANSYKFFSSLRLFLEKFPSSVYTEELLEIFLEIGKEAFQMTENRDKDTFVNMILLNEKIFSKYSNQNQIKLWDYVEKFFTSDYSQIKDSLNMSKLCLLLRFYDQSRYNEYCCAYHANLFKPNDKDCNFAPSVMNPELSKRVEKIFGIIEIYMEKLCDEEEAVILYKILSLDLSPCLQKGLIKVYISYLQNNKIQISTKKSFLDNLLKNNFLEISEFILSSSLLDVRLVMLKLLYALTENKDLEETYTKYLTNMRGEDGVNKINYFIGDNLLPDKIMIELNEKEKTKLINYFNINNFNQDLDLLWNTLSQWLTCKASNNLRSSTSNKPKSNMEISNIILEYCLLFVSRAPGKFIDLFISVLNSYFKDETINNRGILYANQYLYPWVIETIFYFYNKENEAKTDKIICQSIKNQTLLFLCEFIKHRRPDEEFLGRAHFIFKYSYNLRRLFKDDSKYPGSIFNGSS